MRDQLNEGLRSLDLKELVYPTFEIDTFRSKMGEDRDVCVISFQVKDRYPAKDLMEFIEKGYYFVLDADISSGENDKGDYSVFVELPRTPRVFEQINEITYGIRKLTGIDDFKFKYHKESQTHEVTEQTLKSVIPSTAKEYDLFVQRNKVTEMKKFFSKTLMDDLSLENDIVTIHKPFDQKIQFKIISEDLIETILENSEETITIDEHSMSEVFWLTKVLGDYQINKFGDKFLFTNGDNAMLLQRIEQ
jgi:hypothetical protein